MPAPCPRLLPAVGLLCCLPLISLGAEDESPMVVAAPEAEPGPWSYNGKIGFYFNSLANANEETSRDPTIAGSTSYYAITAKANAELLWQMQPHSVTQTLRLEYGNRTEEDRGWEEGTDLVDYDANYKRFLDETQAIYGAVGLDSVFTGPEPDEEPFDPTSVKASAGYAQYYQRAADNTKSSFEWRLGVRVQRTFGRGLDEQDRDWEVGPEFVTILKHDRADVASYHLKLELFSEFEDLAHITALLTTGFTYKVAAYLDLRLDLRAYYESRPEDVDDEASGYEKISYAQDTLIGAVFSF